MDLVKKYDHLVKTGTKDNELEINLDVMRSDINSHDHTEEVKSISLVLNYLQMKNIC